MEKKEKQEYVARISQANRSELVVVMYDMILTSIHAAMEAYEQPEAASHRCAGDEDNHGMDTVRYPEAAPHRCAGTYQASDDFAQQELLRAWKLLQELRGSLDFQYPVASSLRQIYLFIGEKLIASSYQKKSVDLAQCFAMLQKLKTGFEEVARQDDSAALMQNTQAVYAGLTYGKNDLTEVMLDDTSNRGFQA